MATLTIFFMSSFSFRLSLVSLYKLYRIVPPLSNLEKTQFSLPLNEFWQFHLLFILCVLSFDNPMKFATLTIHYKHHDIWPSPIKLVTSIAIFIIFYLRHGWMATVRLLNIFQLPENHITFTIYIIDGQIYLIYNHIGFG